MKIETKCDFGAEVWVLNDNKAIKCVVAEINIIVTRDYKGGYIVVAEYSLKNDEINRAMTYEEYEVFNSKADLLASL